MKRILLSLLGFCALASPAMAQDAPKYLRFIPLGQLPAWEEELIDGVRKGKEFPKGTVPPSPLSLVSAGKLLPFDLTLRAFTNRLTLSGAAEGLLLKNGNTPEAPTLFSKPKPAAPLSLGVLTANPADMLWEKPQLLMLSDDESAFPAGTMRFVNVSDKVVIVKLGDARPFGIKAGGISVKPIEYGKNKIKVGYQSGSSQRSIWENEIRVLNNQRVQCFFYKAIEEKGKDAVKFLYLPEPVPKLPKPR